MRTQIFIVGCGDIGLRVGKHFIDAHTVYGLISSTKRADALRENNITPLVFDLDNADSAACLPAELLDYSLFYFAPPGRTGDDDLRLATLLSKLDIKPKQIIYISTSGVYGDQQGRWVDEATPCQPLTDRAKRRIAAEQRCIAYAKAQDIPLSILRVPGIYGPNRLPLKRLQEGEPLIAREQAPVTNFIHADDLATVCVTAHHYNKDFYNTATIEIFNVSDGSPVNVTDHYLQVAACAELDVPPMVSLQTAQQIFSPMRLSFINESRRLDIRKMETILKPAIRYREREAGIMACLQG